MNFHNLFYSQQQVEVFLLFENPELKTDFLSVFHAILWQIY